jgi:hypothetical protein
LARLGTPVNFSVVARDFFSRLTERYLTYFLSRELSNKLETVDANRQFREALSLHCKQVSLPSFKAETIEALISRFKWPPEWLRGLLVRFAIRSS